jgi:hypothetical protein
MQAIDASNILGIDKNKDYYSRWIPRLKYVWDPAAKTVTVTDETVTVPSSATRKTVNIQVHDKYGNTAFGHMASGGSGYGAAPVVTIAAPGGGGVTATATAVLTDGVVTGFVITNAGTLYGAAPVVTIAAPGGGGVTATATAIVTNGTVTGFTLPLASSGAIDVSGLSVNKGLNISATMIISNGWSGTGSAIHISDAAAGGYLQDWNLGEDPASADASLIH